MAGAIFQELLAMGAGQTVNLTYQSQGVSNPGGGGLSSFTFTQALGPADPNRYIVVTYCANDTCNSMTIGGIAATKIAGTGTQVQIWMARVPTGTSASIVLSTGLVTGVAIEVYSLIASAPLNNIAADATSDTTSTTTGSVNVPQNGCALAVAHANSSSTLNFTGGGLTQDASTSISAGAINLGVASAHGSFGAAQSPLTVTDSATSEIVMASWGPNDVSTPTPSYATYLGQTTLPSGPISGTFPGTITAPTIIVLCIALTANISPSPALASCTIGGHAATIVAQQVNTTLLTAICAAQVNPGDPNTFSATGPTLTAAGLDVNRCVVYAYKLDQFSRINASGFSSTALSPTATFSVPASSAVIGTVKSGQTGSTNTQTWSGLAQDEQVGDLQMSSAAHANVATAIGSDTVTCTTTGAPAAVGCFAVFSP